MDLTFWFIIYKPAIHFRERLTLKSETGNHPGSVCLQRGQQGVAARCRLAQCRHSFLKSAKLYVSRAKPLLLPLHVSGGEVRHEVGAVRSVPLNSQQENYSKSNKMLFYCIAVCKSQ